MCTVCSIVILLTLIGHNTVYKSIPLIKYEWNVTCIKRNARPNNYQLITYYQRVEYSNTLWILFSDEIRPFFPEKWSFHPILSCIFIQSRVVEFSCSIRFSPTRIVTFSEVDSLLLISMNTVFVGLATKLLGALS